MAKVNTKQTIDTSSGETPCWDFTQKSGFCEKDDTQSGEVFVDMDGGSNYAYFRTYREFGASAFEAELPKWKTENGKR